MKLAKHELTPFQASPACALEFHNLKAEVSPHGIDSNRELFQMPCWKFWFFCLQNCCLLCYIDAHFRKILCYGLAHVLRNLHPKVGHVLKNRLSFIKLLYPVAILGTSRQRQLMYCSNRNMLRCEHYLVVFRLIIFHIVPWQHTIRNMLHWQFPWYAHTTQSHNTNIIQSSHKNSCDFK